MTILSFFFGCRHKDKSFPLTLPHRATYVACLECGQEFPYDFQALGQRVNPPRLTQPKKLDGSWEGFKDLALLMAREKRQSLWRVK